MKKQIATPNLLLKTPEIENLTHLESFENRNKYHLEKWEPLITESAQNRLNNWKTESIEAKAIRFFIFSKQLPNQIIGMCNYTQIIRGSFQACYLGYKIDHEFEGKGFMFEALKHSTAYIFEEIRLHRIMANYIPINIKSAKLLDKLAFTIEGYAKNYLMINNQWEDHILTALSQENWQQNLLSLNNETPIATSLQFRKAKLNDLIQIIELLFEDTLGQTRENLSPSSSSKYLKAFIEICTNPHNELIVADLNGAVVGVMQITYLSHLTYQGSKVAHIEAVRIQKSHQNKGFGKKMFQWAIQRAKNHGCHRVQLMTDKRREKTLTFYESLGFSATHEGMKLYISDSPSQDRTS